MHQINQPKGPSARRTAGRPQAGLGGVLADPLAPGANPGVKKILVIDDEPGTIEAIRVVLQAAGYAVEAAEDGAAGLVRATEQLPDLVLCDLYLPTGTGLAVLKRLRAEQTTAALPFILMTGQDDGTTMRRGMALGADDFLVKPFNQESLLAAVEARLRRREVQEQAAQEVKERLVVVIEASADWVLMVDLPHQGITYCNSAAARALEMDGPMPGSRGHLADWMPSEALCCLNQEVLPQVLRQGWWLGETVFRTRTGREIPVRLQVRAHRAKEANLEYVSLVAHDLSASRQAQQQERENARHLRAILETAMDGFWELDLQGRLLQVNLNRAIESTVTVATNEWKYVATMTLDLDSSLPPVPCLPGEINQVILNLVINAAHAVADVVAARKGAAKGTISVATRRADAWVEIRVGDTGPGIPENIRHRVFDPFFTTKPLGKGTGQGLAIARLVVVEKHQGTLTFDTEVGRGTTFVVRLPLSPTGNRREPARV